MTLLGLEKTKLKCKNSHIDCVPFQTVNNQITIGETTEYANKIKTGKIK